MQGGHLKREGYKEWREAGERVEGGAGGMEGGRGGS